MSTPPDELAAERERVRAAYARRRERVRRGEVDPLLYTSFNAGYLFLHQAVERRVLSLLATYGFHRLAGCRILDVGCGDGVMGESDGVHLVDFLKYGATGQDLHGIDIQEDAIARGHLLNPAFGLVAGSAERMPYPDSSFHIVSQSTVFSSILDQRMRRRVAREMLRVLAPGGLILWYDFRVNNPRNPDIRRISRQELKELFPGCRLHLRPASLASPIARRVARRSWLAAYALDALPVLRTHYLGVVLPGRATAPVGRRRSR